MGKPRKYRWDRRRERYKTRDSARQFQSFWGFEIILLILIFAFWLIEARLFIIYAIVNSPCIEATAEFGSYGSHKIRAFDLLFYKSIILGGFWMTVSIVYWKTLRRSKSGIFHLILLGCIVLLAANFRMLHVENNNPPDGTLAVRKMVLDESTGTQIFTPFVEFGDDFGTWNLGKPVRDDYVSYWQYQYRSCVWLEENQIIVNDFEPISGYSEWEQERKIEFSMELRAPPEFTNWPRSSRWEDLRKLPEFTLPDNSPTAQIQRKQRYRQLTSDERARFMEKQKCLKENYGRQDAKSVCSYFWVVDLDAFYANWEVKDGKWWRNTPGP